MGFKNLTNTPQFGEDYNIFDVLKTLFNKPKNIIPQCELPSIKTDLKNFYSKSPAIVWFGHSSFLIHVDGINILVDPVLSGHASPFRFQIRAFKGTDIYKVTDMPKIDWVILTHNHYGHLDYKAIKSLAVHTTNFIMPMLVSTSLNGINIDRKKIKELNWWESATLTKEIKITATPARHFSGRGLKRNGSLP